MNIEKLPSAFLRISLPWLLILVLTNSKQGFSQTSPEKPRIIITADPELDDNNSLIRLILYSSDLRIEGLIYASSQFHWKGDGKGTKWFVPEENMIDLE
ncbi:nucleoside hydrolase-like domain-containing protein [Algoriphagus halophilus]|uniref:nucleoside hydrolase-like domain-containing protein n=1 Tax=Algoriphagus halophilus TaxID=226505 RepID=UPI00358F3519